MRLVRAAEASSSHVRASRVKSCFVDRPSTLGIAASQGPSWGPCLIAGGTAFSNVAVDSGDSSKNLRPSGILGLGVFFGGNRLHDFYAAFGWSVFVPGVDQDGDGNADDKGYGLGPFLTIGLY